MNPHIGGNHGGTAVTLAAEQGHTELMELLLADKRMDPNKANLRMQ